jgi:prepilin-type N-terminal cleavage/methylation domain-containing protein
LKKQKVNIMKHITKRKKGFTLIELLIVISIIGLLSSVVMAASNTARKAGRMAKRLADMKGIQTALELYYSDNNAYPSSAGNWRTECTGYVQAPANNVIPGLVPTYMATFPSDPAMNIAASTSCYLYLSDGTNYKLLDHVITDLTQPEYSKYPTFMDPARDGGPDAFTVDGNASWALAIYTFIARNW